MNNYAVNSADGHELGWDATIENDSTFTLIPAGEYDFTVKSFARGRHNGSEKLPPCNKATLTLTVHTPTDGDVDLTHNLFLHTKCEGMLCAFFTCIGLRKHGEKLSMDWTRVPGAHGKCKIDIRTWKSKDGNDMQSNEIKKFLEPENAAPQTVGYTPGAF